MQYCTIVTSYNEKKIEKIPHYMYHVIKYTKYVSKILSDFHILDKPSH